MVKGKNLKAFSKLWPSNINPKKIVKRRTLNTKGNRVYVQDSELSKLTKFQPGVYLKCIVDTKTNTLIIRPSEEGKMKVAKRQRKNYLGSVIDIRKKDILKMFSKYELLDLVIFEDEIIVTGLSEVNNAEIVDDNKVVLFKDKKLKKDETIRIKSKHLEKMHNDMLMLCSGDDITHNVRYGVVDAEESEVVSYSTSDFNNMFSKVKSTIEKVKSNAVRVVSLCSGAGLLDKGFYDEGYKLEFALELEEDMAKTYAANLGDHIVVGDLSTYPIDAVPDAEICITGVPCHEYSNANRVTGKDVNHPKNLLIRRVMDILEKMKSLKVFVIENVPQILTKGKVFIEELFSRMSGFDITIKKVDSSKYGSAQKRERAIIIGSKIGPIELPDSILAPVRTVRDAFRGITDNTPNQLDYSKPKGATLERMKYVPQGGNHQDIPEHLRTKGTHSNLFYRLHWDSLSKTITNVRKSMILHPEEDRILSVRECARLFDLFPEEDGSEYVFEGSLANKQQMIANAVPVSISRVIAREIKKRFNELFGKQYSFNFGKNATIAYW